MVVHPIDLDFATRHLLQDRFEFVKDRSLSEASTRCEQILRTARAGVSTVVHPSQVSQNAETGATNTEHKLVAPKASVVDYDGVSVPVPEGYRNVAWLRTYEAKAI
jgi:hypothetical protein